MNKEKIPIFDQDLPINFFQNKKNLAIDTETMGLNLHRDRLSLMQISDGRNICLIKFPKDSTYESINLRKLLSDTERLKIFHFARFDLAVIKHHFKIDLANIFCTKIASLLVRTYSSKHSLKELCRELLNVNISKSQQTSYWGDVELTKEQQEYAANDVKYLHQIKDILHNRLIIEKRDILAQKIFDFIIVRSNLDLLGWQDCDIFAHNFVDLAK